MVFRFRYESLLRYRQHLKEKAEIDLALARQKLRQSMEKLETWEGGLKESREALDRKMRKSLPSPELQNYSDYFIGLEERIGFTEMEIIDRERAVRQKMQVLLSKSKDYQAIEKLKEKDFNKWNHHQQQEERKRMNETAVLRHGKTSS